MKKLLILIIIFICAAPSYTAILPADAGGNNPGAVTRQYVDQYRDLQIEKKYIQTVPEDLDREEKLRQQDQIPKDYLQGDVIYNPKFKLKNFEFEGNTIYSDKKLRALGSDIIGREVYLEDVMNYAIKVSRFYQQNGYITTYAYIPPQEATTGVVKIVVSESRVGEKIVTGNFWTRKWFIKNIATGGTHLSKGRVFNVKQLQGAVKQINKSGYMATTVAIEKNQAEETIIELDIQDRFPVGFDVAWDDYGRDLIGRQRGTMVLGMDNLTGFGDKIYGGTILAERSTSALAGYSLPVSTLGTRLSFDYSYSNVRPKGDLEDLQLQGHSNYYMLRLTHPFINNATTDLIGYAGIDFIDSTTAITAIGEEISDYTLRVARFGVDFLRDDRTGRWLGNLGVDIGIDGLGASNNIHNGPQSSFEKIVAMLARVERLPYDMLGIIRVNGQYTPQSLFAAEQMFIGGPYSIRGYQPSEIIGDYGVAGSVELRFPIPGLTKIKRFEEFFKKMNDRVKLLVFYDWGYVKEHKHIYDYPKNFLHSVGFGTNVVVMDGINFQMGVGFPLGNKSLNESSARLYFSINTEIDKIFLRPKSHVKR